MLPNIMVRSEEMRTLPLGLDFFRGKNTQNTPLIAAASNIISLPVIIIYLVFQKNLIKGMMVGAVKGLNRLCPEDNDKKHTSKGCPVRY